MLIDKTKGRTMATIVDSKVMTYHFYNDSFGGMNLHEVICNKGIFRRYNPITFYAKVVGYYKQSENEGEYNFNDVQNILTMVKNNYNINKYDDVQIGIIDNRKVTQAELKNCYNILTQFVTLGLSIVLDYSFDNMGGSNQNYLSFTTHLSLLEGIKSYTFDRYIDRIEQYMRRVMNTMCKDKNVNSNNLFFVYLGHKSLKHFGYADTPDDAPATLVFAINDLLKDTFDNWNKIQVAKDNNVIISDYMLNKRKKELEKQQEEKRIRYEKLLKEFDKLETEFDVINFVEENTKDHGSIYARGYINPTNMPERTTTVNIIYNPNREGKEWTCYSRDYRSNDDYCGSDGDMARRYLAGAWYQTFTTETKLNVMVDGLSFEKEFKE